MHEIAVKNRPCALEYPSENMFQIVTKNCNKIWYQDFDNNEDLIMWCNHYKKMQDMEEIYSM